MDDQDDTVNLHPAAERDHASDTTIHSLDESLPEFVLPPTGADVSSEQSSLWNRFLHALLRAMAPWPV